jgi:selenocysteine lyase/cysteine desulfurase
VGVRDDGQETGPVRGALSRRQLLAGSAAVGAGALTGCFGGEEKAAAPAAARLDPGDWASVKAAYPLDRGVRHFAAFGLASHAQPVRAAIERHRAGLDRNPVDYMHDTQAAAEARVSEAAAAYLDLGSADFAFTDSTTQGLGLVYGGIRLDGEVLTTEHDHYATHEALRLRAARDDVRVRHIRLYRDPARTNPDEIVSAVKRAVTSRTSVLALTWVHSRTGVKLPLQEIAAALDTERRHGMTIVVDGVHGLGVEYDAPNIYTCDVFIAGCHKWLGGPRGTGLVWSLKSWEALQGVVPSFATESYVAWLEGRPPSFDAPAGPAFQPGGFHSFEHRWALAEAFELQRSIGRVRVSERIHALARRLKEGLAELPHVKLVTPLADNVSAGLVCFDIDGMNAPEAVERLRDEHKIVASVTPYAVEHVRLGTGLEVDEADVDAAVAAVAALRG